MKEGKETIKYLLHKRKFESLTRDQRLEVLKYKSQLAQQQNEIIKRLQRIGQKLQTNELRLQKIDQTLQTDELRLQTIEQNQQTIEQNQQTIEQKQERYNNMRYKILKENEPLDIATAIEYQVVPSAPGRKDSRIAEITKISTNVFTDGSIVKEEENTYGFTGYYYDKQKTPHHFDNIKLKTIYFKDHSYVIVYLIREEYGKRGNVAGLFNVIADIRVYLKEPEDKKALKEVKTAIKEIERVNNSTNYTSVFTAMFGPQEKMQKFEPSEVSEGIYTLKRIKK